jgi:hypothetical protein
MNLLRVLKDVVAKDNFNIKDNQDSPIDFYKLIKYVKDYRIGSIFNPISSNFVSSGKFNLKILHFIF